jgi:hypothetical protein
MDKHDPMCISVRERSPQFEFDCVGLKGCSDPYSLADRMEWSRRHRKPEAPPAREVARICTRCGKPISANASFVGDGDGGGQRYAHYECFYPMGGSSPRAGEEQHGREGSRPNCVVPVETPAAASAAPSTYRESYKEIIAAMLALSPKQRRIVLASMSIAFCTACGNDQPRDGSCQCWNDE